MNHAGNTFTNGVICSLAEEGDSIYDLRGSTAEVDCPECLKIISDIMAEIKRDQEHA